MKTIATTKLETNIFGKMINKYKHKDIDLNKY